MLNARNPAKTLLVMPRFLPAVVVALLCALSGGPARAQMSQADLLTRIDRLEGAIRDLTGQVEQLQFRNQQLSQQLQRLQEATPGAAIQAPAPTPPVPPALQRPTAQYSPQPLPPPAASAPPPAPVIATAPPTAPIEPVTPAPPPSGRRGDAFNPALNPTAPGAPRPLGTSTAANEPPPPAETPAAAPRQIGAPLNISSVSPPSPPAPVGGSSPGELPPPPPANPSSTGAVAALPPTNSPKDEYDLGYGYIQRKDYASAADTFGDFLHKYPSDRLAPEAQFWLGEALFQRQKYRDAAEAFLAVSTKYETTARAPDALLRLGMSLSALGEKEAACASLGEVLRKYPRASLSVKQGVEREQKRAHC